MTILVHDFLPGNLVRARGREWVVQTESRRDWLRLRPLGGVEDETIALLPELELLPVEHATFEAPDPARAGNHAAALLLRDALRHEVPLDERTLHAQAERLELSTQGIPPPLTWQEPYVNAHATHQANVLLWHALQGEAVSVRA